MIPLAQFTPRRSPHSSRKVLTVVSTARLIKVIGALFAGLLVLSACGTHPGAAAVVNGNTIAEQDVSQASSELSTVLDGPVNSQAVLQILIVGPTAIQVAARHGMGVSADDAGEFLDGQAAMNAQEPLEEYSNPTLTVARYLILQETMQTSPEAAEVGPELAEAVQDMDIELSPRYGEWTPEGPTPTQPEWLLEPAPQEA